MMCANFASLEKEIFELEKAGIDSFHIDIMDGNFVDNFGMGYQDMEYICKKTDKDVEVHLMIEHPERYLSILKQIKPDVAYIHPESTYAPEYVIDEFRKSGIRPCIAINPGTSIYMIHELLNIVDRVLIMCVNPGHAGRKFEPYVEKKINQLIDLRNQYNFEIYLDGACTLERITKFRKKGVTGFVLGTSVLFGHEESYKDILLKVRN